MMWIVCQIGAREHYAISRALDQAGKLGTLITDFWVEPRSLFRKLPGARRLKDRYHSDLNTARVISFNPQMLLYEAASRLKQRTGWDAVLARNALFQRQVLSRLSTLITDNEPPITLFSYSYAARELFHFAKSRGWKTVMGQIDPGPEEERIVAREHERYPKMKSSWKPAPTAYWNMWREEIELADRIIINSDWSRQCLRKEGVPEDKMEVIPLVYDEGSSDSSPLIGVRDEKYARTSLRLLFLGQINLRKGIGRLLEAMRLLRDEPIELMLAGPAEIDPTAWADLPNVQWIGPVPRSEVGKCYQRADVFILPTLSDGFALTQLEALAHGIPVVASRQCGEAVGDEKSGWVLNNLEPSAIADLLRSLSGRRVPGAVTIPATFGLAELARALAS